MKTKQNNDVIDRTYVISIVYETQLSKPIKQCEISKEDQKRQQPNRS